MERFRREAESLARLDHPNIVRCIEHVREADGVCYHVTEYVEGRDLNSLVQERGVFPVAQALECLLQTAKGLQSAHSLQIVHRDIRPANLMLDRTDAVRILDFGLARVMLPDPWGRDQDDVAASRAIMGTIPYMSPEQAADSKRADVRSDIYSLGCTLHFLLTGRPPYRGRTWSEMFLAHRQAPIPSLKAARPSVPDYLDDLFRRMLAKDPADRPPTMASVIAAAELALAESRARLSSSQTRPVRCFDEPDGRDREPTGGHDDPRAESPEESPPEEMYYTGRRIRAPYRLGDFLPLARYLLLAGALIVALVILIKWLQLNAQGAEPLAAAAEDQVFCRPMDPCFSVIRGEPVPPGMHRRRTARSVSRAEDWLNCRLDPGPLVA
jgi:serine/threonine protein kinase